MSFPRYPKYRPSGVEWLGEVPEHWAAVRLRQLGRLLKGSGGSKEDIVDEGVPCVRYGDLYTTHRDFINHARTRVSAERAVDYVALQHGDVLFAGSGETFEEIGKSAVNLIDGEAVCGGDLIILRPEAPVNSRFLGYACDSSSAVAQKAMMGRGTTVKHIYPDELRHLAVCVPPQKEQVAIAAFLDRETAKIDALVAEQERLIELLKEKRQAVISHAVTKGLNRDALMRPSGIEWLGDIPSHWALPPLYLRCEQALGKMLDNAKQTGECPVPYLRNVDVRWDHIDVDDLPTMDIAPTERDRFTVRRGDLLTVEGRELGRSAIWNGDDGVVGFQKALHRLRPLGPNEHPRFLYYTMVFAHARHVFMADQSPFETPHLTGETLRRFRFPRPPLTEQREISAHLNAVDVTFDASCTAIRGSLHLLRERRSALISAAVTGQIDVRELGQSAA